MGDPTEHHQALAESTKASARSAARYAAQGKLELAQRALVRAQRGRDLLAVELPVHSRMRRTVDQAVTLAERCLVAPVEEESDETGEIVKSRARLSTRTERASLRR